MSSDRLQRDFWHSFDMILILIHSYRKWLKFTDASCPRPNFVFFFSFFFLHSSMSIASSLVGEDAKTKFLSKMGQLTTSGAMLANVFQRKK